MTEIHILLSGIKDKFFVSFVDGVVGKMNEIIFHIFLLGPLVILSRESSQAFFMKINSHGIMTIYKNINPHIKFKILY
jgi:hypothetical protein